MMKDFVEKVQVERSTVKVENGFLEKNSALLSLISNTKALGIRREIPTQSIGIKQFWNDKTIIYLSPE